MAICFCCKKEMTVEGNGCTQEMCTFPDGRSLPRIPYEDAECGGPCHDCNVTHGQLHHPGCDVERCPACGSRSISCGCQDEKDGDEELGQQPPSPPKSMDSPARYVWGVLNSPTGIRSPDTSGFKGGHVTLSYSQVDCGPNEDVAKCFGQALENALKATSLKITRDGETIVVTLDGVSPGFFDKGGAAMNKAVSNISAGLEPYLPSIRLVVNRA